MIQYNIKFKLMITFMFMLTLLSLFFNNYYIVWMFMEIVTMTMIFMLIMMKDKYSAFFYFLVSMISSLILYFTMIMNNIIKLEELLFLQNFMMLFSLYLKLGLYPLNFWYMMISKEMNWMNLFLFSTILKIQPLYLMYLLMNLNKLIMFLIMMNLIMTMIMILNTKSIKLVMVYSSIMQTSLMMMMMLMSIKLFIVYMFMYIIMSFLLFWLLNKFNINNKVEIYDLYINKSYKIMFMLILILYSNLPPMSTFMMKWILLENMIINYNNFLILMFMLLMSSIMMTWNYLNLFMNNFYIYMNIKFYSYSNNKNWKFNNFYFIILFFYMFMFIMYIYIDMLNF